MEQKNLEQLAHEVHKFFTIPGSKDSLLAPIVALIPQAPSGIAQIAEAFCSNVRSLVSTAGLPYIFALAAARGRRYQLFHCAAELEAVIVKNDGATKPDEHPSFDARRRLQEMEASHEGRDVLNHEVCEFLIDFAKDKDISDAAAQLVSQAAVLTWSAFEVLSRDIFIAHLNSMPKAYTKLLADSDVRKRFDLSRVSIERVAEFNFDLTGKLGDLLIDQNDLADLGGIKATFVALFPSDSVLRQALNERDLWLLFQRRNLIVHRRGIVDQRYLDASGDEQSIGSRLTLRPTELDTYLKLVTNAARAEISAAIGLPTKAPGN